MSTKYKQAESTLKEQLISPRIQVEYLEHWIGHDLDKGRKPEARMLNQLSEVTQTLVEIEAYHNAILEQTRKLIAQAHSLQAKTKVHRTGKKETK